MASPVQWAPGQALQALQPHRRVYTSGSSVQAYQGADSASTNNQLGFSALRPPRRRCTCDGMTQT
jgi:hypothetical protein